MPGNFAPQSGGTPRLILYKFIARTEETFTAACILNTTHKENLHQDRLCPWLDSCSRLREMQTQSVATTAPSYVCNVTSVGPPG